MMQVVLCYKKFTTAINKCLSSSDEWMLQLVWKDDNQKIQFPRKVINLQGIIILTMNWMK